MPGASQGLEFELHFAHSVLSGGLFAGIGSAMVYAGLAYVGATRARWIVAGMGALWRFELTLDLMARRYLYSRVAAVAWR